MRTSQPRQRARITPTGLGARRTRQPRGFTLVEMLVVVAIITLLLGLAAAMGPAILSRGAENTTKVRLQTLQAMYEGYLSITGQSNEGGIAVANMQEFLEEASQISGLEASMNALGDGLTEQKLYLPKWVVPDPEDGGTPQWEFVFEKVLTVFDGWDNAIFFKAGDGMTGRDTIVKQSDTEYFFDPIGEVDQFNPEEARFAKIPDVGQAYFASPGPNGFWGRVETRPLPPDSWQDEDDSAPFRPQDSSLLKDDDFQARYNVSSDDLWTVEPLDTPDTKNPKDEPREQDNLYSFELR